MNEIAKGRSARLVATFSALHVVPVSAAIFCVYVVDIDQRDEVYRFWELYENLRNRRIIEEFEVREDAAAVEFGSIDEPM